MTYILITSFLAGIFFLNLLSRKKGEQTYTLALTFFVISWLVFSAGVFFVQDDFVSASKYIGIYTLVMGISSLLSNGIRKASNNIARVVSFGLVLCIALVSVFSFRKTIFVSANQQAAYVDTHGELLVEIKDGFDPNTLKKELGSSVVSVSRAFNMPASPDEVLDNYYVVDIDDHLGAHIPDVASKIRNIKGIVTVEDNEVITIPPREDAEEAPRASGEKLQINDPLAGQQWSLTALNAGKFYSKCTSGAVRPAKKVLLAILDTGIDSHHEDISANYKSIDPAYDNDPQSHGTHCAGIASAVTNNGVGIASFNYEGRFYDVTSVKVLNQSGFGTQKSIIDGMIRAVDAGAQVLSLSLGGPSSDYKQKAYSDAVKYAAKKGCIVVVAAGNNAKYARNYAPANTPGVITVGAIDAQEKQAAFSNSLDDIQYGILAPGVDILSTVPQGKYASYNGTSMATPLVASIVAVLKSVYPDLSTAEAYDRIRTTGKNITANGIPQRIIQPAELF